MSFYERLSDHYNAVFPFNEKKTALIENLIRKENHALDIGCATGELVFTLEGSGMKAIGIDSSARLIELAVKKKKRIGSEAEFIKAGMQDLTETFDIESFDLITCIGNTLVHLKNIEQVEVFFKNIFDLLRSGGAFFGHILNYGKILKEGLKRFKNISVEGTVFKRDYVFNGNNKIIFQMSLRIEKTGEYYKESVELLPLTYEIILESLEKAGFEKFNFFGDFTGNKYSSSMNDIIFVVYK